MTINETANIRKLATIAKIIDIQPISEADNIEHVFVRGWKCVAQKGNFKIGDFCVYVEVDSVMPDGITEEKALEWKGLQKEMSKASTNNEKDSIKVKMAEISATSIRPEFEFLRASKFRIKTRRIFGEISQGIVFPLSILPEKLANIIKELNISNQAVIKILEEAEDKVLGISELIKEGETQLEGMDVTELLGVTQFIPPDPADMGGDIKGDMENLGILVSDEERLENLSHKYEDLKQFKYYKTEKLEGTSFAAVLKNDVFSVTGRTIEFKTPEPETPIAELNVYWKMARKLDLENKMREIAKTFNVENFAIQGELIGEGIQKNIYKLHGQKVYFYNMFDIDRQEYWSYGAFIDNVTKMSLDMVPILEENYVLPEKAIDLLEEADRTYSVLNPDQLIEGFVFIADEIYIKPNTRITRSNFQRLSFKAKSRTYDEKK